jgi:hypothetical protein
MYDEFAAIGWIVSRQDLKVLWVEPRSGAFRLWFKAQAVYKDKHSLFFDIRGRTAQELLAYVLKES